MWPQNCLILISLEISITFSLVMDEIYKVSTKFRQITSNTFEFNFFRLPQNRNLSTTKLQF